MLHVIRLDCCQNTMIYHKGGLFSSVFNLANLIRITKLTVHHYEAIYTASMDFFPYSTEIRQFKIPPIAFIEQIGKYSTRQ